MAETAARIHAFWCRIPSRVNFGDALTPWLIRRITGQHPLFLRPEDPRLKYFVVGSIIGYATGSCAVWGAGIMSCADSISPKARLLAVRGPLTRARALAQGVACPEIYGDPALLLPRFYQPAGAKMQDGALVPHFSDMPRLTLDRHQSYGLRLIDIQDPIETVIDRIAASTFVASSSLHGLIASHAYGVPAVWVKFRDLPSGDDSKFRDYYLSIGQEPPEPIRLASDRVDGRALAAKAALPARLPDLDRLWNACPFRRTS
jgi:pyruvyltransferase